MVEAEIDATAARQARWAFNDLVVPLSREKCPLHVTLIEQVLSLIDGLLMLFFNERSHQHDVHSHGNIFCRLKLMDKRYGK